MNLPDQTPKLPKWPFLVGDAALLATAWIVADGAAKPLHPESIAAIVGCVICAGLAGGIPFLADYARRQDEALDNRQRSLEALARDATAAAEQISIAAVGLRDIAEAARKSLDQAEKIPAKLQEQIASFGADAAKGRAEEKKALEKELSALGAKLAERFEAAAAKIVRAATEQIRLAAPASSEPVGRVADPASHLSAAAHSPIPSPIEAPTETPESAPAVAAEPSPSEAVGPEIAAPVGRVDDPASHLSEAAHSPSSIESPAETPAPAPAGAVPSPKPPRKRAPKKPVVEEPAAALAAEVPVFELEAEQVPPAASEFSQSAPDEIAPASSIAADGASRLLVTAYIGIGNRLFIRGEGPGLSWDQGVPLQFVSIGKWRWDTSDAVVPIAFKLYKNDEIECAALGTGTLEPGHQLDVTASF